MRFLTRALGGLFLAALTVGLLALAAGTVRNALEERANREPGRRPASEQVFAATVRAYAPETITPVLTTFGEIQSRRTLQVRASAAGRVIEMGPDVEDGGLVEAGQLIVRIDPVDAERALRVAETDLADAEAERVDARSGAEIATDDLAAAREQAELRGRALDRQRDLSDRGVGTTAAVEDAELSAASARQQVLSRRQALADAEARLARAETAMARAEIAVDEARRAVSDTEVTAAFSGALSDVGVTEGGLVSQNEEIATLIDPAALEVAFRVSTADYVRLLDDAGDLRPAEVTVSLDVGGTVIESPATITRESAAVGDGQTGRQIYARLAQPRGFRPGDFARVRVLEPPLDGVARLPETALATDGTVLVLGPDERLELAEVTLLRRQGDDVLVRAEGLEGREIVTERSRRLGPGIKVRPVRPGTEGGDGGEDGTAEGDDGTAGGATGAMSAEAGVAADGAADGGAEMVEIDEGRRAELIAMVEDDAAMAPDAKERVLAALRAPRVPAGMIARIEGRDG